MRGDFSRKPFRHDLHAAGIVHQQGRVWLDGDWNENVFHRMDLNEQEMFDVIGPCGIPDDPTTDLDNHHYLIEADPALGDGDFRIRAGCAGDVDGILSVLDADTTYLTQPDLLDPPPLTRSGRGRFSGIVYLEVWRRLITYLEDESVREIALEGPDTIGRIRTVSQIKVGIVPTAREQRITCENAADFLPKPGSGTLSTDRPEDEEPDNPCRLPDDTFYTGRENRLYRVEIHDPGDVDGLIPVSDEAMWFSKAVDGELAKGATTVKLATPSGLTSKQIAAVIAAGVAQLSDDDGNVESLIVTKFANETLTLAQPLVRDYRADKHPTVLGGVARFKWSRDNASFGVRVTGVDAGRRVLTLASLGRDQVTVLRVGDLVEIADDASELGATRGHLAYLSTDPNPDLFTVELTEALPAAFKVDKLKERHLLLRKWDGVGWAAGDFDAPDMDLGDGVRIKFEGADLRSGDWWNIKTRRVDGSVETRTQAPPDGIERHHCVLGIIGWERPNGLDRDTIDNLAIEAGFREGPREKLRSALPADRPDYSAGEILDAAANSGATPTQIEKLKQLVGDAFAAALTVLSDCRQKFPPLIHLPTGDGHGPYLVLKLIGGDGQQGPAGDVLPCPLIAGIENHLGQPVADAVVQFSVTGAGDGVSTSFGGPFTPTITVATGPATSGQFGLAQAFLQLGRERDCHPVVATIVEPAPPQGTALPVIFEAHLAAPFDKPPEETHPRVVEMSWQNDRALNLDRFNEGLVVVFSETMIRETATLDTFVVTIETPELVLARDEPRWVGHRPLIVFGGVIVESDNVWRFRPCPPLEPQLLEFWLEVERGEILRRAEAIGCLTDSTIDPEDFELTPIRVRVTLKGNAILAKDGLRPLDGDAFGEIGQDGRTDLLLPCGDGTRGGDFESWFYFDRTSLG